jgi:hypothetical protein
MWLKAPIIEVDRNGKRRHVGGGKSNRLGTPQGGIISPLLANIYLHLLDRIWVRQALPSRLGARIVRYADDIVILCRQGTERPLAVLRQILTRLGLRLNETKTRVVETTTESFDFLGFTIGLARSKRTGRRYTHVEPSKKSLQAIKDRITRLTSRKRTPVPLEEVLDQVNVATRGWVGYFHFKNCSNALTHLREHVEQRLRRHLCKRHKVRDRGTGYAKFSNRALYGKYGLFKVPTTAGWTKAHASR